MEGNIFEQRYLTAMHRLKLAKAQRSRLGIPWGYRRAYDVLFPDDIATTLYPMLAEISRTSTRQEANRIAQLLVEIDVNQARRLVRNFFEGRKAKRKLFAVRKLERKAAYKWTIKNSLLRWSEARKVRAAAVRERLRQKAMTMLPEIEFLHLEGVADTEIARSLGLPKILVVEQIRKIKNT